MTDGPDRRSAADDAGTPEDDRPAPDAPGEDGSPGSRLGTEADPLEELRRRQYAERQAREREEERRQRELAEREERERRERERREEERGQRELAERDAEAKPSASPSSGEGGARPDPPGRPEAGSSPATSSTPEAPQRPHPGLPSDPQAPQRPRPQRRVEGDETRPLPSVESSPPRDRPAATGERRASDDPPVRRPWERPAPAAFSSPGSRVEERASTRPEPAETRPMPTPGPSRPEPAEERRSERTQAVPDPSDEAAIPRLRRPPRRGPVRRRLTAVDARSIFKLALVFYLGVLITLVAGATVLWLVLTATGVIGNVESFLGELLGYEDLQFVFSRILVVSVLVGLVWVVVSAAGTALFAVIYNRASQFTGGLGVTVDDDA